VIQEIKRKGDTMSSCQQCWAPSSNRHRY